LCISLPLCAINLAGAQVKLDIKTPLEQKPQERVVKAGLIAYLKQSEWARVVKIGEDFSVWILNYQRRLKGDTLMYNLELEVRTAAMITRGKLIATRHISDTVDLAWSESHDTFEGRDIEQSIERKLKMNGNVLTSLPALLGFPHLALISIIHNGLKNFGDDLKSTYVLDQAVEGMVVGAKLMKEVKEMLASKPSGQ